jgi:nucleoid-associated protein YgaU
VCLVWIAMAVAVSVIAQAPGTLGRAAGAVAQRVTPALIRRAVHAVFGLSVVTLPPVFAPAAHASTVQPVAVTAGTPAMSLTSLPSLDRPGSLQGEEPVPSEQPTVVESASGGSYVVQRGDSLWSIAARHLPSPASASAIANAWPRWYAANRDVIGDDPNLILPGQVFRAPAEVTR